MTDLKDFNKPDIFSRVVDELLLTIRGNLASVGRFDAGDLKNVPIGFIKMDTSDDNLRLYKHVGNNKYNLVFDYNQFFQSNIKNVSSNISMVEFDCNIPDDLVHWLPGDFNNEENFDPFTLVPNKNYPHSLYTSREGEINLTVTKPGWVNMIIVGPGGTAMKGDRTDRTGIYSVINNFTDIQANMKTTIEGDAFRYAFNEAGISENHVITVPGFSGDDVQTEVPATFTKAQMQALKGLDAVFYRGARADRGNVTVFQGGASGAVRLDPDVDSPPYDFGYPLYINRGFGQGEDLIFSLKENIEKFRKFVKQFRGQSKSDGGLIPVRPHKPKSDIKAGYVGFGGGSSFYDPDNTDVYGGRGGGGAAMIKLRIYLTAGTLKINVAPADVIYQRCLNQRIKLPGGGTATYDPAKHGGLPGGRGVVIIEPMAWSI